MSENSPFNSLASISPLSDRKKSSISINVSSSTDSPDNRWSDVVPPNSALTFAAVWDPEDGMVTFSGAHLLNSSREYESSPSNLFDDDVSQIVDIEDTSESEENTPATETFQDAFRAFLHRVPRNSKFHQQGKYSSTLASSTLDGLDLYSRDPVLPIKPRPSLSRKCSCQCFGKLDGKDQSSWNWKARAAFPGIFPESDHVSDEGFFEDLPSIKGRAELKSQWSVTTTSTSAYVEVPRMSEKTAGNQNHIPHPLWIADKDQPVYNLTTPPNSPRRLLKKRRPSGFSSTHNSSSDSTSPVSPSSPTSPSGSFQSKRSLSRRLTKAPPDDSWVCIEISPFITQRVVEET